MTGANRSSNISESFAFATVRGEVIAGGLVGVNESGMGSQQGLFDWGATITSSVAGGSVTVPEGIAGGLIGSNISAAVLYSAAVDTQVQAEIAGGLIGGAGVYEPAPETANKPIIDQSFVTGRVKGTNWAGGLIGDAVGTSYMLPPPRDEAEWDIRTIRIRDSYSAAEVEATRLSGGLIAHGSAVKIERGLSFGKITTTRPIFPVEGGLVGDVERFGTAHTVRVTDSFFNRELNPTRLANGGQGVTGFGVAKSDQELRSLETYSVVGENGAPVSGYDMSLSTTTVENPLKPGERQNLLTLWKIEPNGGSYPYLNPELWGN